MSGARIVSPVPRCPPYRVAFSSWMPSCLVAAGRAARSLKFWSIMSGWASVRWFYRRLAKCAKKGAGRCWWRLSTGRTLRPGRPGVSIWHGWLWWRRKAHATLCGRLGKLCRAVHWARCCAGRGRLMPGRRGACRWQLLAAIVWLFCSGRCKPRPKHRRLPCAWYLPQVRVAIWRSICSSGAARRAPKPFISMCHDR